MLIFVDFVEQLEDMAVTSEAQVIQAQADKKWMKLKQEAHFLLDKLLIFGSLS